MINKSISISDKTILPALSKPMDPNYHGNYATTSNKEDAFNVFGFVADNTTVEWGINGYKTDKGSQYLIRTSHEGDRVSVANDLFNELDMTFTIHTHPGINGEKKASGYSRFYRGDMAVITRRYYEFSNQKKELPRHYIYHQKSRNLYNYTPWNPSIYIKK